jgi:ABC-2 type transport system ATP-binding protein
VTAVDDLTFQVPAGQVTGFLGPNGSGKSTTIRMIVGLDSPSSGTITVNGRAYGELQRPLREVGALLEARATHPGRSAAGHLRYLALSNGIPRARVDERAGSPSAWANVSGSPRPCSGTHPSSSWTSR